MDRKSPDGITEAELNAPQNAPEAVVRYEYYNRGVKYVDAPAGISGGVTYIRSDLVTRRPTARVKAQSNDNKD